MRSPRNGWVHVSKLVMTQITISTLEGRKADITLEPLLDGGCTHGDRDDSSYTASHE